MRYVILVAFIGIVAGLVWKGATTECKSSHMETQYKQPASVVVGQSKDFGGIAVPMGNMRPVEVEVCDEYGPRNEDSLKDPQG